MLPEWTFGLLLGFHIDQRRGSCVGAHTPARNPTGATFPVSPQIRVTVKSVV